MEHTSTDRSDSIRTRLWFALCVLAVLPVANLWLVEALSRQHPGEQQRPPVPAVHRSFDDSDKLRDDPSGRTVRASTEHDKTSESTPRAREFGTVQSTVVAIAPATSPLAASPSFWLVSESAMALLSIAVLFSVALGFVLSAALAAGRISPHRVFNRQAEAAPVGATRADQHETSCDARRLAEQLRLDIGEMVHAMRSPIAVVVAYAERLKSIVPSGDVRARRAIDAVGISGAQLNDLLDGAWRKGNELASLFLAERQVVDLADILRDVAADDNASPDPGRIVMGAAGTSPVSAPPGVLEEVVDECLSTILGNRACTRVVATADTANGLACLHLAVERETAEIAGATELSEQEESPLLVRATRTVAMLGGNLTIAAAEGGVRSITMTFPTYAV